MKKIIKQVTIFIGLAVLFASLSLCTYATGQTEEIKVGYVVDYGMLKGSYIQGEEGYGYEYLTNLMNYMDGDYTLEFVHCDGFEDGLAKLDSGEIDIFGPTMQYEDLEYIYTSNTFGDNTMMLAKLSDSTNTEMDASVLNGATIGVPDYYMDNSMLLNFLEEEEIEATVVSIPSENLNIIMGIENIDFVMMSSMQSHLGLTILDGLDNVDIYLIANPENQDLVDEIDAAIVDMKEEEPYFIPQITMKYSSYNFTTNAYISEDNLAIVQDKGVYKVGIRDFSSALIGTGADGEMEGVAFDFLNLLAERAGISFECVALEDDATQEDFDAVDFMISATNSTAELGFPYESNTYLELPMVLITQRESGDGAGETVGVPSYYRVDDYMVDGLLYGREVVEYSTVQAAQEAFDAGEVNAILITVVSLNMLRDSFGTEGYIGITMDDPLELALAFSSQMSREEMTVFNKLISTLDQTALETSMMEYATVEQDVSLTNVLEENPWILLNVLVVLAMVIFLVAGLSEIRRRVLMTKSLESDQLTGLSSEQKLIKDIKGLLEENPGTEYNFISIDIDNFKYVNEMYGYDSGSQLLKLLASYMQGKITAECRLARCTGDQFLLVSPAQNAKVALQQWEQLNETLQALIMEQLGLTCYINFSIGVYVVDDLDMDISMMIDYANIARNKGKGTIGFTCHYFTKEMARERALSNEITTDMVPAIEREEFVLYYQPKVDMNSETVVGAEVLVRWITKEDKLVPPNSFIPLFEKNGFIETLDYYVLSHTCQFMQKHPDLNVPRLSVNLSSLTMLQENIVRNVLNIVSKYQIKPSQLDLEITETAFIENGVVLERLGELRTYGFTISMDDFGTGVSSLNRLKNIELDTLKIDREFIIDALENPRGSKILEHVVTMAKDLELETVAEGIETEEQHAFLKALGCDFGQGYLYARPLPETEFVDYCQEHFVTPQ